MSRLIPWLPALVWAMGVWLVGGIQDVSGVPKIEHLDKAAHFGLYAVLGFLLAFGWIRSGAGSRWMAVGLVALALALGALDERRQGRLKGRSQDRIDWVADAAGAITGFAAAALLFRRRTTPERTP